MNRIFKTVLAFSFLAIINLATAQTVGKVEIKDDSFKVNKLAEGPKKL